MLDLLLQRGEDLALWQDADIAYVVVDDFHTYNGAQGTDVGMRCVAWPPPRTTRGPAVRSGKICPVTTSATLGESGNAGESGRFPSRSSGSSSARTRG